MDIVKEQKDALNALLKVRLNPEDYQDRVDAALRSYRKQVALPGFRPGKVPMGMVKSKYGKALLADEINKILGDQLNQYIKDNDLQVLGSPIPSDEHEEVGDWNNPQTFEFTYELGLAPEFDVDIEQLTLTELEIEVTDEMIDEEVTRIRRIYGKMTDTEVGDTSSMFSGTMIQLDEHGNELEGGITSETTLMPEFWSDEATKQLFVGLKAGDEVVVDPHKVSSDHDDLSRMLKITHEQVHHLHGSFRFKVREIRVMKPAELTEEFFQKAFSSDNVTDEATMRQHVRQELAKSLTRESGNHLKNEVAKTLLNAYSFALPEAFLKRYIIKTSEEEIDPSVLEREFEAYGRSLRWQLIMNKINKKYGIKVENDDLVNYAKKAIVENYARYGMPEPEEDELTTQANSVLRNQKNLRELVDLLYEEKLVQLVREKAQVATETVSLQEFSRRAKA